MKERDARLGAFTLTENGDGGCEIEYEDIGGYGGMDYEAHYRFDPANRALLEAALSRDGEGTLSEMTTRKFGPALCDGETTFFAFLERHDIRFELFTWTS